MSFVGNFEANAPKQSSIDALFRLLNHGVAINMLVANYVINAQRDFHSSQSPGNAFYNVVKTWDRFRNTI